jgi:hypothetical protein
VAYPTKQKTWTYSLNNSITYSSLIQVCGGVLLGLKNFLKANGFTVKGSCDGTTGAMDAVDRWTTVANVETRSSTETSAACSWIVLTDANGVDHLFAQIGASDDCIRLAYDAAGGYTAAGTATHCPVTSNIESKTMVSSISFVSTDTTNNRVWWGWVDSTHKSWRLAIYCAGACVNICGVDVIGNACVSPASLSPSIVGFQMNNPGLNNYTTSTQFFVARPFSNGALRDITRGNAGISSETWDNAQNVFDGVSVELQGNQPIIQALGVYCNVSNAHGKLGNLSDWYRCGDQQVDGAVGTDLNWVLLTGSGGTPHVGSIWPWDGATTPQTA